MQIGLKRLQIHISGTEGAEPISNPDATAQNQTAASLPTAHRSYVLLIVSFRVRGEAMGKEFYHVPKARLSKYSKSLVGRGFDSSQGFIARAEVCNFQGFDGMWFVSGAYIAL